MAQVARTSEEILPEDRVTNVLIQQVSQEWKCYVEVPYNNYGERGYVDLVRQHKSLAQIWELKSNPKSANQVIRQFQKMLENFEEGTSLQLKKNKKYYLAFTASQRNLEHLKNNKQMYLSLLDKEIVRILMVDKQGNSKSVYEDGEIRGDSLEELKGISIDEELICPYCGKEYVVEGYFRKHVKGCFE